MCNGKFSIALLENSTFYLISRDHNQPIKRPEFNEVLCDVDRLIYHNWDSLIIRSNFIDNISEES